MPHELCERTATELAALIRAGEVSSREVVAAHLSRIDEINGTVNAITSVLADSALAAADLADRAQAAGKALGLLHGVPFTVKANLDCLGSATTHGVPALRDALPYLDAPIVVRMKSAGAIVIGRTNLSELGLRLCTDNPLHGRTRNPRHPKRTAGGSSGGDAVAVATGMSPIGLGTDLGGSLRVPAHCCGVAALKPTTGRIAHAASLPPEDYGAAGQLLLAPGPLTRSVADLRLCLTVLAGRDVRDPRSVDVPLTGAALVERRAALVTTVPEASLTPGTLAAVRRAGACLEREGWQVEEVAPPEILRVGEIWHQLVASDLAAIMPALRPVVSSTLFDYVERLCEAAARHRTTNTRSHEERSRLTRAWSGFLSEYPVIIGPTLCGLPWPVDADLDLESGLELVTQATRFILPGNALGLPVVALPMDSQYGLPTSIQIYADLWREDLCLQAAAVIERHIPATAICDPVA